MPDTQGPFNIAHAVLGTNVFFAPYDNPEKFRAFMQRITRHWREVQHQVRTWIGENRLDFFNGKITVLAECSVNLVSTEFYEEFILEHDLAAVEGVTHLHLHPCSGPHVFYATLKHIPNITVTEAGSMEHRMAAGAISVDDALTEIGDRPIMLSIGQELPEGREFEFIKKDIDRYADNKRLVFGYSGSHWLRKDRNEIRDLHRKVDEYFHNKYN